MNTANEQTKNSNNDFQNSNLTNSGSKKFTRDYDKEPLMIKDYSLYSIASAYLFILILCIFCLCMDIKISNIVFGFTMIKAISSIKNFFIYKDDMKLYFLHSAVQCKKKNRLMKRINLSDVIDISDAIFVNYDCYEIQTKVRIGFILALACIAIMLIAILYPQFFAIFVVVIVAGVGVSRAVLNKFINGKFSLKKLKSMTIFDKSGGYITFLVCDADYKKLKIYFLLKTGRNLDDIKISINYPY